MLPRVRYALAGLALGVAVVACRQIVGIHDDPIGHGETDASANVDAASDAGAPACGIAFAPSTCAACAEQRCCAQARACTESPGCKAAESCLAACAGDFHCRAQCAIDFPVGALAEVPTLDQCLAASCTVECGMQCGNTEFFIDPDAGGCKTCLSGTLCAASLACAQSADCQAMGRCFESCRTADCNAACVQTYDAGASFFYAELNDLEGACRSDCHVGGYWSCVGHVVWPTAKAPDITFSPTVTVYGGGGVDGVTVKMCAANDTACGSPIAQGTTHDGGLVELVQHVGGPNSYGLNGFLDLMSPDIVPTLYFWSFPLSESNAHLDTALSTFAAANFKGFIELSGQMLDPEAGQVGVNAVDCYMLPAADVEIAVTANGRKFQPFYVAGSLPSMTATATDGSGIAGFVNVPVGVIDVTVTPKALGKPSSHVTAFVRKGTYTEIWALPTP